MFITSLTGRKHGRPDLSKEEKKELGIGRMGDGKLRGTRVHTPKSAYDRKREKRKFRERVDREIDY